MTQPDLPFERLRPGHASERQRDGSVVVYAVDEDGNRVFLPPPPPRMEAPDVDPDDLPQAE